MLLPGKSHGQRSLIGYSPWGRKESDTTSLSLSGLPWCLSWKRTLLQCRRPGFDPWVGKIPWKGERLPTPVFWPGEFLGSQSQTRLNNFHFTYQSRKPQAETSTRTSHAVVKPKLTLTHYWKSTVDNLCVKYSRKPSQRGASTIWSDLLQDLEWVFRVNTRKDPTQPSRSKIKIEALLKCTRACVLNKACPQGKLVNQSLSCWVLLRV